MSRIDAGNPLVKAAAKRWEALARRARTARRPQRARVFVVSAAGNVALVERHKRGLHYWTVPGGGIEPGETPEEAAIREIREELGLDVTLERRVGQSGAQVFFLAHVETEWPLSLGGPEQERNSAHNSYLPVWVPLETAKTLWLRPPGSTRLLDNL